MRKLQIVICDDNRNEAESYAKICREVCDDSGVLAKVKCYSEPNEILFDMGDEAISSQVNILLVEPDGIFTQVPDAVRQKGYDGLILYVSHSNSPEHYHQAFDVNAFNYVRKGVTPKSLSKFQSVFKSAISAAVKIERQYLAVSFAGEFRRIEVKDIHYFETAEDHMVNVVYAGGNFKFPDTMKSLEEQFSDRGFVRVQRSYLVSVDAIHRVTPEEIVLNNGLHITISRGSSSSIRTSITGWQTLSRQHT